MNKDKMRIGLVGAGRMGGNMIRHLHLDCGYSISRVYDLNPETACAVADEVSASVAESLQDVTRHSDIILTVVSNDAAMAGIYFDAEDNLLIESSGKIFINCATVSPEIHKRVETAATTAGAASLEAPMASSIPQARDGSLFLMVGGMREVFDSVCPLMEDLSKDLYYIGPAGTAAAVKALVNMVMNINTAGLAEGLGLAESLGLDLAQVTEIFSKTGAHSRVLETDGEDMLNRDHDTFFSAEHAAKDSGIALELGKQSGLHLPLTQASKLQFDQLVQLGLGNIDKSGVSELTFPSRRANPDSES